MQASASFDDTQQRNLRWLLSETFEPMNFGLESFVHPEVRSTLPAPSIGPHLRSLRSTLSSSARG